MLKGDSTQITGLNETLRGLRAAGVEVSDLKAVFQDIADRTRGYAETKVPKRSGKLLGTLRSAGNANKAVLRVGAAKVAYAGPINFGWPKRGIKGAEFLKFADQRIDPELDQLLTDGIGEAIRKAGLDSDDA